MKLSESLRKNLIETTTGGLLNKFKIKTRRDVLFFEDILLSYARECETLGFGREIEKNGMMWGALLFKVPVHGAFRRLPPPFLINKVIGKVFVNLGLMDEINLAEKDGKMFLRIKNEAFSKGYEGNIFLTGLHSGFLSQLYGFKMECTGVSKENDYIKYVFEKSKEPFVIKSKSRETYNELNCIPDDKGFTIKDALKSNILKLREDNKLYFRGRVLNPLENTIFHLLGSSKLPFERLSLISYDFFNEIIEKDSTREDKLKLFKNLLQLTGWGRINIISKQKALVFDITNPPYGFQPEKDNWEFIIRTVLGYLWIVDKRFRIKRIEESRKRISVEFSVDV